MALIRKTQKTIPAFKTFLPKQPLQHFHILTPRTNPLHGAPAALLPLHQRTAVPNTRAYSTTSDSNKSPFFWAMVGQTVAFATAAAYFTIPDQPYTVVEPEVKGCVGLFQKTTSETRNGIALTAHQICSEIQGSYDYLSLNQIKTHLSKDSFPDEESFAKHIIAFKKSALQANKSLADAFSAYASERAEILEVSENPAISRKTYYVHSPSPCLPPEIAEIKDLEELDLLNSNISGLPDSLADLKSLRKLSISGRGLKEFPVVLTKLTGLTHLNLNSTSVESLPEEIGNLKQLKVLNLSHNKLKQLPESISRLTELEDLYLYANHLTQLPETMGSFSKLRILDLRENSLSWLPQTFKNLKQIKILILSHNRLTEIPDSILNLTNLTNLNMSQNRITKIPVTIGNLSVLESLDLSRNQITEIPSELLSLTQLTGLNLSDNQITCLPDDIEKLKKISELNLNDNNLTSLPRTIGNLNKLVFLYLGNNGLTELPTEVGNLKNLHRLHLKENKLKTIPASIVSLNLSELDLADNPLEALPVTMGILLESDPWKQTRLNLHGFPAKGQWEKLSDEQRQLLSKLKALHKEKTGKYYLNYSNIPKHTLGTLEGEQLIDTGRM